MRARPLLMLALLASTSFVAAASDDQAGKWVKAGDPAQINVACTQVWECTAGMDILHAPDEHLVTTPNQITTGTCGAGDGPVDSCNVCLAQQPSDPCVWHMEKD